jgi:hypothetical protein
MQFPYFAYLEVISYYSMSVDPPSKLHQVVVFIFVLDIKLTTVKNLLGVAGSVEFFLYQK